MSERELIELATRVYTELDAEIELAIQGYKEETGGEFPCSAACTDCCADSGESPFVMVPMREAEAALLRSTILSLPENTRSVLATRALTGHNGCFLLHSVGMGCYVYKARPLWCRIFGLPGLGGCDKMAYVEGEWVARWLQAVNKARLALEREGGRFVVFDRLFLARGK